MAPNHPASTRWFIHAPEGSKGPFDLEAMRQMIDARTLGANDWIWREGLDNWVTVRDSGDFDPPRPGAQAAAPEAAQAIVPRAQSQDDHLDGLFVDMVKGSWARHRRRERATELDEVLVGGVITATLDNGYSLIDLNSDGTNHYLRFEKIEDGTRLIFQLRHMAEHLLTAEVLGHEAHVQIGYGERVKDFGRVWSAIRQEMKGGYIRQADPGIITVDGDISSQYIYVEVGLIWDLKDYLDADDPYRVRYPKLGQDIGAAIHALRKYLRGRLG